MTMLQRYARHIRYVAVIIIVGGIIFGVFAAGSGNNKQNSSTSDKIKYEKQDETVIETGESLSFVRPKILDQNTTLSLIGTVLSNETADIYVRRSGIIKDLYVDIGDSVSEGQVIGLMLPPGVEGESNASIFEKQVRLEEAKDNLQYTKNVAANTVQKAKVDWDLKLIKKDSNTPVNQSLEKMESDIASAVENLDNLIATNIVILDSMQEDIDQALEQGIVLVDASLEKMEHAMLGESHTNDVFSETYVDKVLGATNVSTRYQAVDSYRQLYAGYQNYMSMGHEDKETLLDLLDKSSQTLSYVVDMLDASLTSSSVTQSSLSDKKTMLLAQQTTVLQKKEKVQDLYNMYQKTKASQEQQEVAMKNSINSMNEQLRQMKGKFASDSDILGSDLDKAQQDYLLTKSQQDLLVQQKENMVKIAQAQLQQEYAKNGNNKIISPFSGIVSKRRVRVGNLVSMSSSIFELVDVKTTLAEKAKREIQFGLPEEYHDILSVGGVVSFSLPDDALVYTASISRISPQVDESTQTITVQAKLDDSFELPHNTRVNVIVDLAETEYYQVPSQAILYEDGSSYVFVKNEEKDEVEQISVTVIADDGEFADIQGNISEESLLLEYSGTRQ